MDGDASNAATRAAVSFGPLTSSRIRGGVGDDGDGSLVVVVVVVVGRSRCKSRPKANPVMPAATTDFIVWKLLLLNCVSADHNLTAYCVLLNYSYM